MTKDKENTMPTQKKKTTTGRGLGMSGCTSTHQTIIRDILRNFQKLFPKYAQNIQTDINVIDRPGTKGRRFPDISLWQYAHRSGNDVEPVGLLMTIEITHTSGNDEASKKTIEMTFRHCPSLVEAFLYNYKKKVWIRYWRVGNIPRKTKRTTFAKRNVHFFDFYTTPSASFVSNKIRLYLRGMHQSTIKRAERVRRIVAEHYEEGNLRRCKSAIYRRYVRDELGISQRTYFRLLSAIVPSLNTRPAPMQLSLF